MMMGGSSPSPQWYPVASSFAEASPVVVTAGSTTPDIHFFFTTAGTPLAPPVVAGPPSHDRDKGAFGLPILTETGGQYQIQKSYSMREGTWFNLGSSAWGDGTVKILQDASATEPRAFYRVLRK